MNPIKPLVSFDNTGWEQRAEALLGGDTPVTAPGVTAPANIRNPEDWVHLEGRSHGSYSYNSLFVSMHRLGYTPEVEQAARKLSLTVTNTGVEADGHQYIGSIQWDPALRLNRALGNQTLVPRQGIDLMLDLREALDGKKTLVDGRGNALTKERLRPFYNEMWEVREPWRAEWLDARFSNTNGVMRMAYDHQLQGTNLVARSNDVLMPYLEDSAVKADLATFNPQGLPTKKSRSSALHFWKPSDGSVAWFVADSDGAGLVCGGGPSGSYPQLGVFACAEGARAAP